MKALYIMVITLIFSMAIATGVRNIGAQTKDQSRSVNKVEIELTKELDLERRIDDLEFRVKILELESGATFKKGDKQ